MKESRKNEARQMLQQLSAQVFEVVKLGEFKNTNEAVILTFYKKNGHEIFRKFSEWKELGYNIIKGSKGFPVWGRPVGSEKDPETGEEIGDPGDPQELYFPICYLFSNLQTEILTNGTEISTARSIEERIF